MKKLTKLCLSLSMCLMLFGCSKTNKQDIVIINTTDVHCGINEEGSLGYSKLSAYKKELIEKGNYVSLVDSGDFSQGGLTGAISKGEYIIRIMNNLGYDAATIGNHDFDYGMDALADNIEDFNGDMLACNLSYTGSGENKIKDVKPYTIKEYGKYKIGYVGITTPEALVSSNPKFFKENDKVVYDFKSNTATEFYTCIQENINSCKKDGADYIILVGHTGNNIDNKPFTSNEIIENTTGYVAFMDGHTHDTVSWVTKTDKEQKEVYYCQAGTKLNCFSTLTITKNGKIETNFVTKYDKTDTEFDTFYAGIESNVNELKNRVLTNIDISLYDDDNKGNGVRLVRNRETALGNMIADSYRIMMNADIGFINGGGIRDDLLAGDVTYGEILDVHPFGNSVVTKKVLGSQILDYLEYNARMTENVYKDVAGNKMGENAGFANVSGLKFTIKTSIPSTVIVEDMKFVRVDGERRVVNVQVLENGAYVNLDPSKYYTVASNDYILVDGGDGNTMFLEDELIPNEKYLDYEVVIDYIVNVCGGKLATKYSDIEGRIIID